MGVTDKPAKSMRAMPVHDRLLAAVFVAITLCACAMTHNDSPWIEFMAHAQNDPCPGCSSGVITGIIDGDTLDVESVRIRLALVDSPERGDPGYEEAASFAASLCRMGDTAFYNTDDGQPDGSHGRVIAEVFCNGKSLNAELVQNGHARILYNLCDASEFAAKPWTGCALPDHAPGQTVTRPGEPAPDHTPQKHKRAESYVLPALAVTGMIIFLVWRRSRNVGPKPGHL
ncbi:MAG: thermonuclease family protein [Nitrosopumilus sp. H13]|nr:MAG: thermonuclease family protein [Nitrosopumilus sp. H13]